jgi:D-arabinose 1-dehydrogenase-like Zn-dependent alcohol dehydrogenase
MNARVTAITSSPAKVAALEELGAETVIVSEDLRFHKKVARVDVVLDCVGAPTINASLRSLRPTGRCVVVGNVTTERVEVNPGLVILNELSLVGSAGCNRSDLADVLAWVQSGELKPIVADALPLASAADAHRRLEQRQVTGRIVLRP